MDTTPTNEGRTRRALSRCSACRADVPLPEFTMAFQPIVDVERSAIYAYEALVRWRQTCPPTA
jgi:EAL domain-containing protein (putative c-di-GMP-specific phosphodiesterase class I)